MMWMDEASVSYRYWPSRLPADGARWSASPFPGCQRIGSFNSPLCERLEKQKRMLMTNNPKKYFDSIIVLTCYNKSPLAEVKDLLPKDRNLNMTLEG
jgi:hypothetical protein